MRRLKHKHTRRAVKFLKINYGFREPFKASALWSGSTMRNGRSVAKAPVSSAGHLGRQLCPCSF